ncbi:MAG: phosphoribosylamine--glycine ligase [Candidatus Omnitrophota bacterium]
MKILVIGSGGREHALVWKLAQEEKVKKVYCAPGNAGIAQSAQCLAIEAHDLDGLLSFAKEEKIDLTVVGPEVPLVNGIVDRFQEAGLKIFGPSKKAARLEGSKAFAKEIMRKYGVPTAEFFVCKTKEDIDKAVARLGLPVVLKADGLAAGKGVVICRTQDSVEVAAKQMFVEKIFGNASCEVVVEKCLEGEEASILVLTDGKKVIPLVSSQDHKRACDGDQGPNTGGMGAYSPAEIITDDVMGLIMDKIINPMIDGLSKEGIVYKGVLYAGIMMTSQGPYVLEFNVRFGDPETQAVLPRLTSDLSEAMMWTISGTNPPQLQWKKGPSVCVVLASGGYPGSYEKGKKISGLKDACLMKDVVVFHAGTKKAADSDFYETAGGRVLGVVALGSDLTKALHLVYDAVGKIRFDKMFYRRDIGWRALKAQNIR